jgi:predicted ester cyclase
MGASAGHREAGQFDEIVILQIRDGKVLRQRGIVDNLSALRQLGAVALP